MNKDDTQSNTNIPEADLAPEDTIEAESTDETMTNSAETQPIENEAVTAEHDTIPEAASEKVESEVAKLKAEAEKNLAGWQRERAEFQNYKRRTEREQKDLKERITLEIIGQLLPIIDDFERAMENVPEGLADNPWLNGVSLIQGKFQKLLDTNDITVIDPVGEPFDPNHHQAISKDDSDEYESDHVIQTLQKGYISGKTLLRPAMVRVAN